MQSPFGGSRIGGIGPVQGYGGSERDISGCVPGDISSSHGPRTRGIQLPLVATDSRRTDSNASGSSRITSRGIVFGTTVNGIAVNIPASDFSADDVQCQCLDIGSRDKNRFQGRRIKTVCSNCPGGNLGGVNLYRLDCIGRKRAREDAAFVNIGQFRGPALRVGLAGDGIRHTAGIRTRLFCIGNAAGQIFGGSAPVRGFGTLHQHGERTPENSGHREPEQDHSRGRRDVLDGDALPGSGNGFGLYARPSNTDFQGAGDTGLDIHREGCRRADFTSDSREIGALGVCVRIRAGRCLHDFQGVVSAVKIYRIDGYRCAVRRNTRERLLESTVADVVADTDAESIHLVRGIGCGSADGFTFGLADGVCPIQAHPRAKFNFTSRCVVFYNLVAISKLHVTPVVHGKCLVAVLESVYARYRLSGDSARRVFCRKGENANGNAGNGAVAVLCPRKYFRSNNRITVNHGLLAVPVFHPVQQVGVRTCAAGSPRTRLAPREGKRIGYARDDHGNIDCSMLCQSCGIGRHSEGDALAGIIHRNSGKPSRLADRSDGETGEIIVSQGYPYHGGNRDCRKNRPVLVGGEYIFRQGLGDCVSVFLYSNCRLTSGNQSLCHKFFIVRIDEKKCGGF